MKSESGFFLAMASQPFWINSIIENHQFHRVNISTFSRFLRSAIAERRVGWTINTVITYKLKSWINSIIPLLKIINSFVWTYLRFPVSCVQRLPTVGLGALMDEQYNDAAAQIVFCLHQTDFYHHYCHQVYPHQNHRWIWDDLSFPNTYGGVPKSKWKFFMTFSIKGGGGVKSYLSDAHVYGPHFKKGLPLF